MSAADNIGPHLLGRIAPPDDKHVQAHPFAAAAVPPQGIEVEIKRPTLDVYDQGQTPKCVAYSTSKVMNWFNKYSFNAPWLYDECKKIDGWAGDGTSARYACDVLRSQGHWRTIGGVPVKAGVKLYHGIASNTWAQSVDDIRAVFARQTPQPVLVGIDWHEAWFRPETRGSEHWFQKFSTAGANAGGHEIGIWACSDKRQAFGFSNTWGAGWPSLVWMDYATMDKLFAAGADACVLSDLASR